MLIGVLGDSHYRRECIDKAMVYLQNVDLIIHTGDNYRDIDYINNEYNIEAIGVMGNCDEEGELEIVKDFHGKRFLICHGHRYDVKRNLNGIFYRGKETNANIVIFGHSHVPCYAVEESMILLNPGSVSEPRGGSSRSIALVEIQDEIKVEFIEIDEGYR